MIIAITGGTGFIGKLLVNRHIQMGDHVRLLSRKPPLKDTDVQYFLGDLSDKDFDLSSFVANVDILYHCAGEINNESLMRQLHVNGTQRLVDTAKGNIGRWVQLSSVGAYGKCLSGTITEKSKENPSGVYESTKTESDKIVKKCGIPYSILRPSNVFCNNMPNQSLKSLLRAVRSGLFFFIGKENESIVNYVHVVDVVEVLIKCGLNEKSLGEVFNLSQSISVEKMVASFISEKKNADKKILRLSENFIRKLVNLFEWIPGFPLTSSRVNALTNSCIYNSNKVQKKLNFNFSMSLEERLALFAKEK
jgi:nucleoside-diphosphate-sugar epimerase